MADLGCVWLFGGKVKVPCARAYTRSVCDVQRRCSYSCRLWRYISVIPYLTITCIYLTSSTRHATGLTVDGQDDRVDVELETDNSCDALESRLVIAEVRHVAVRPPFTAVRDASQSAPTRQARVARKPEVGGDVASADVEFDVRRRISTESDAAQRAGTAVDKVNADRR